MYISIHIYRNIYIYNIYISEYVLKCAYVFTHKHGMYTVKKWSLNVDL